MKFLQCCGCICSTGYGVLIKTKVWNYRKTCLQLSFTGPSNRGLCRQVVLVQRCFSTTEVDNEPAYSGLYRQVHGLYV